LLRGFGNVLVKELKELFRDPKILLGMIIVPLLMFPVLGAIMSFSVHTAQEKAATATTLILNNDAGGNYSDLFISFVKTSLKVYVVTIRHQSKLWLRPCFQGTTQLTSWKFHKGSPQT